MTVDIQKNTQKAFVGATAMSMLLIAGSAMAAEAMMGLEEIIVTAQKRAESLQDTPISIAAFTASGMERLGISDIGQIANMTPNLVFDFTAPISGASNAAGVFIRGVGQSDFALTTEAGVGTYVDGVYMSRSLGGVLDVLDIERIEILRGPQGTLFGRNTIGGAISITSQKPNQEFGGSAQVAVGNHGRLHARSSLNIPIADNASFRLAASSKQRDGYVKGLIEGGGITPQTDLGNENRSAVRGTFLLESSSAFSITMNADYTRIRENNAASTLRGATGLGAFPDFSGPIVSFYNTFAAPSMTLPGFSDALYDSKFITGDRKTTYATGPNGSSIDAWGASVALEWEAADNLTVKSITAYRRTDGFFNRDADGSPLDITHTSNYDYEHKQFSQELQFIGSVMESRLRYAAGVYYFKEKGSDPLVVDFPDSFGTLYQDIAKVNNRSIAGYVQATFSVTNDISFTGGIRYTEDKKEFLSDQYIVVGSLAGPIFFGGAPEGTVIYLVPSMSEKKEKYTNWSPRASIDYRLNEELMTYVSFSKGFKSGGFNLRYVVPRPEILAFDPEKLTSYEVGFKWEGLQNRMRINAAAFTSKYSNIQVTVFENLGAPVTQNAGAARLKGFEVDFSALPLPELQISGGVGYLSSHYTYIAPPSGVFAVPEQIITLDDQLANAPAWQLNGAADYTIPLSNRGNIGLHVDWSYTNKVYNDAQNSAFLFQKAYHMVNAGISYGAPEDQWRLRLFVENLGNKRYIVSGDSNYGIGFHEGNFNRPREWGAELKVNF